MNTQMIISISREFGSGGHEIAQKLAEYYDLPLLDNNLLSEIAAEKHLDIDEFSGLDEKKKVYGLSRTVRNISSSLEENVAYLQFEHLKKRAESGESFVVVGRCSEEVLRDFPGLVSVFILGDKSSKVKRIMERYQVSEREAAKLIREKDNGRKQYHNSFCKGKWGKSTNYNLSINSSKLGIDATVKFLISYIDLRKQLI